MTKQEKEPKEPFHSLIIGDLQISSTKLTPRELKKQAIDCLKNKHIADYLNGTLLKKKMMRAVG